MSELRGWLVVMTKPRMELEAKEHLERQGFDVYLPFWIDLRRRSGGWQKVRSAMFPRYLFVRPVNSEQSISPIRSTRGVSQLVRFGKELAWASDALIEDVRVFETARNSRSDELKPFKKGDQILVLEGPFRGISAEVLASNQKRVVLLLHLLGKNQKLELDAGVCQVR